MKQGWLGAGVAAAFVIALGSAACGAGAPVSVGGGARPASLEASGAPIIDPLAYLVQHRCADGSEPWSCADPQPQMLATVATWRKRDWPPPAGYQVEDSALRPDGAVVTTFSYPPFGRFVAAHGDGGEVYRIDGGAAVITETRDGGTPHDQFFVGRNCGGTGWLLFRTATESGSAVARLSDRADPASCATGSSAFTKWRMVPLSYLFVLPDGSRRKETISTIVSDHFASASPARARSEERFLLTKYWGRLGWQHWSSPGSVPPVDLSHRCAPSFAPLSATPPAPGWVLTDCRIYTVLSPAPPGWSVAKYGWPP